MSNKSVSSKLFVVLEKVTLSLWSPNFAVLYATKFHPKQYIFNRYYPHKGTQFQSKILPNNKKLCQPIFPVKVKKIKTFFKTIKKAYKL